MIKEIKEKLKSAWSWIKAKWKVLTLLILGGGGIALGLSITILNVHSHPQAGDMWQVDFTTVGRADLTITPQDQLTIDDLDFVSLKCGEEERTPQILENDVIFYPNWFCTKGGSIIHLVNVRGNHTLKFQFGDKIAYAYNQTWYNNDWSYRIKLDIDPAKVDADLTNFPVYVDLSNMPAAFFTNLNSDGSDIRVTTDDGITEVAREVVFASTTAQTGELHFNATGTLSSTATTTFYVYYGNSAASDYTATSTYGRNNVWTNNYEAVFHLQEGGTTDASAYKDSSGKFVGGTGVGNVATNSSAKIGTGTTFDGTGDYIDIGTNTILNSATFTLSAWINTDTVSKYTGAVVIGATGVTNSAYIGTVAAVQAGTANSIGGGFYGSNYGSGVTTTGSWIYLQQTFGGGTNTGLIYVDGALKTTGPSYTPSLDATYTRIGRLTSNTGYDFDGSVDEARIISVARTATWISTEYNNQNLPSTFYNVGTPESQSPWYNASWLYRVKITVYASTTDADLTDYPVYVNLNNLPAGFHTNVNQTDARDIRVTTNNKISEIPREVVFYASSTDTGELHFKGNIYNATDTDFYIYYGNAAATEPAKNSTYGSGNVWNSGYEAVYHLQEASGNVADSTTNDEDATSTDTSTVTGVMGKGRSFNGTSSGLIAPTNIGFTTEATFESWVKADVINANYLNVWSYSSAADDFFAMLAVHDPDNIQFTIKDTDYRRAMGTLGGTTNFYHVVGTVKDNDYVRIYVDGATSTPVAVGTCIELSAWAVINNIGNYPAANRYFDGNLDEVRISNVVRSATWISTGYNNQSSPNTFYDVGSEETSNGVARRIIIIE